MRQSVADHIALISNAAKAAKAHIGVATARTAPPPQEPVHAPGPPRPAVDFSAQEPAFAEEPAFDEAPALAESPAFVDPLPEGAINVDNFAMEGVDDEGIPVWEDPP